MKEFLNIKHLTCGYPQSFTINDISFTLKQGMFGGIVGPNGSGKTTLFKGISGEIPLLNGQVYLNGCDMKPMSPRKRARRIAIVSQHIENIDISVEEFVLMGRMPYRTRFQFFENTNDFAIAEKYMKLTDTFHLRKQNMNQLSGGEQQLAAIARALTQEPELLLLDEPTSHLDITHQVQVLNLIQQLNTELHLTVLMIIHDLNLASEYCDYLVMINNGMLYKKGDPEQVLTFQYIEDVYKTVVITQTNPLSKKPAVFLVSNKVLTSIGKSKN